MPHTIDNPTDDTIVAISTAPGRAGIGIVRLSGPAARALGEQLLRLRAPLAPGRARLAHLLDLTPAQPQTETEPPTGETPPAILDEVLATFFQAPRSYTGEDVLEIAAHGAPVLLEAILRAALARGARLAEPGEFTRRAFRNGRLDLAQAEAVHDLIASTTLHQARVAAAQLGGALSRQLTAPKSELVTLIAALEAGIDFAEDDLDLLPDADIASRLARIATPLRRLESTFRYGNALSAGLSLTLAGAPNTGKSSLFNALLGRDRAIVTPIPGTTRDTLSEPLTLHGLPLHLTDTAGLRDTTEPVERLGIERSREALADSAALLLVLDASQPVTAAALAPLQAAAGRPTLLIANKLDLTPHTPESLKAQILLQISAIGLYTDFNQAQIPQTPAIIPVSALTGQGLPELCDAIHTLLAADSPSQETVVVTNLRQQSSITEALSCLSAAADALAAHIPHEMLLLDLHRALHALDALTGATSTDDILHQIFSTFCIGK